MTNTHLHKHHNAHRSLFSCYVNTWGKCKNTESQKLKNKWRKKLCEHKIPKLYEHEKRVVWCIRQDFNKKYFIPDCANKETDEGIVSWTVGRDKGTDKG